MISKGCSWTRMSWEFLFCFVFKDSFWCGQFLKSLLNLLQYCFCFCVLVSWLRGMWDLSSPTRGQTHTPCIGRRTLNHWTAREVPCHEVLTTRSLDAPQPRADKINAWKSNKVSGSLKCFLRSECDFIGKIRGSSGEGKEEMRILNRWRSMSRGKISKCFWFLLKKKCFWNFASVPWACSS